MTSTNAVLEINGRDCRAAILLFDDAWTDLRPQLKEGDLIHYGRISGCTLQLRVDSIADDWIALTLWDIQPDIGALKARLDENPSAVVYRCVERVDGSGMI